MAFDRINRIIPVSLQKAGISTSVVTETPLQMFERRAIEALSDLPPGSFRAISLVHGTLTVSCRSSRAAYRLRAIQNELLASLTYAPGDAPIARVSLMISTWR